LMFICVIFRSFLLFFFFQAEDGIRDFHVTGVQTCALPISAPLLAEGGAETAIAEPLGLPEQFRPLLRPGAEQAGLLRDGGAVGALPLRPVEGPGLELGGEQRSEERRVGKAGRGRGGGEWCK